MTEEQVIAKREYNRRWYLANKTASLEKSAAYAKANPDVGRRAKTKWRLANPEKMKAAQKRWEAEHPGVGNKMRRQWRTKNLEKTWGYLGYPKPTRQRPDLCECCGGPPTGHAVLHLDHCHETGKFRGWLCGKCNVGLGMFRDSPVLLQLAVEYLKRSV